MENKKVRTRISQKEAAYIVQILEANIKNLQEQYDHLEKLKAEVFTLKRALMKGDYGTFLAGKDKRAELEQKKHQAYLLYQTLHSHQVLLKKYKAIADGERKPGCYKHLNNNVQFWVIEGKRLGEILQ